MAFRVHDENTDIGGCRMEHKLAQRNAPRRPLGEHNDNVARVFGGKVSNKENQIQAGGKDVVMKAPVAAVAKAQAENFDPLENENLPPIFHKVKNLKKPEDVMHYLVSINSEYVNQIIKYLREFELKHVPSTSYMSRQRDITHVMRSILVDWLVEVSDEFNLKRETLFLAINYLDRFLSKMSVARDKLQLVGTTALFLAAKFEEIYPPGVSDFVYLTDNSYENRQVIKMEQYFLTSLEFNVSPPTVNNFLTMFILASADKNEAELPLLELNKSVESLAYYIAELSLVFAERLLGYPPSLVAACCLYIARNKMSYAASWTSDLQTFSGYKEEELNSSPCSHELHDLLLRANDLPQQAVRNKYNSPKFHEVSKRIYF